MSVLRGSSPGPGLMAWGWISASTPPPLCSFCSAQTSQPFQWPWACSTVYRTKQTGWRSPRNCVALNEVLGTSVSQCELLACCRDAVRYNICSALSAAPRYAELSIGTVILITCWGWVMTLYFKKLLIYLFIWLCCA